MLELRPDPKITYRDASRISGRSVGALRNAVSRGKLHHVKGPYGNTLIPLSSLDKFTEAAEKHIPHNTRAAMESRRERLMTVEACENSLGLSGASAFQAIKKVIDETIEKCAKVAESGATEGSNDSLSEMARALANEIRALKGDM